MSAAKPLSSQVGGHAGVLATEDGSLIIKPALPLELQFYHQLQQNPDLESLRPFAPKFIGILKLEGQMDEGQSLEQGNISITPSLVLENLSHPFIKPNILDIKLGTVLYDESASPEKVERMIQTAKNTTSLETGIRLTGFQVYDNVTRQAVNTPKAYGKSIKPLDLPDGMLRFFPVGVAQADEGGEVTTGTSTSGLPLKALLPIIRGIRQNIAEIREAFSQLEIRMVGGSLLVIYEADWTRAEEALKHVDDGDEEDGDDDDDDDDDDEDKDEDVKKLGPPFLVKLIDFAHTRLTSEQGPDEGVLLGMDTVLKLIDGRIAQLELE